MGRFARLVRHRAVITLGPVLVVVMGGLATSCHWEPAYCGNGIVEGFEQCDDGNTVVEKCERDDWGCKVCDEYCREVYGITPFCGDDVLDDWEECDPGRDPQTQCPYGVATCELCNQDCVLKARTGPFCGNGRVDYDFGETCDDWNTEVETCAYGEITCTVCGSSCIQAPSTGPYCGDGNHDPSGGEACDDGNETEDDGCDSNCTLTSCGNGILTADEVCDIGSPCPAGQTCLDCACKDNICVAPKDAVLVGQLDGFVYANRVEMHDGLVYVAGASGLHVVEVTMPAHPRRLGSFDPSVLGVSEISSQGLAVTGGYAFSMGSAHLHVFDVTNPLAPFWVNRLTIGAIAGGLVVIGDYAYTCRYDPPNGSAVNIIDITSPEQPELVGSYPVAGASTLAASGSLLFIGGADLEILDIIMPMDPQPVGAIDVPWPWGIDVVDDIAYLAAAEGGLILVDVSDPIQPAVLSTYMPDDPLRAAVNHVNVAHQRAYIRTALGTSSIETVDVSDPTDPQPGEWLFAWDGPSSGDAGTVDGAFGYFIRTNTLFVFQVCDLPE